MKQLNFVLLLILTLLTSCVLEHGLEYAKPLGVDATFVVGIASANAVTREIAEGGKADNELEEITILLFNPVTLKYVDFARATSLTQDTNPNKKNLWRFAAKVPKGRYRALFLANAATVIDAGYDLAAGTVKGSGAAMTELTMNDIEFSLSRDIAGKYNAISDGSGYKPFVMSSDRIDLDIPHVVIDNYELDDPVWLSRDVAKINVKLDREYKELKRFEIKEIWLCNYNTVSYAVPTQRLWGFWNSGETAAPLFDAYAARPATTVISGCDKGIVYKNEIKDSKCVDWIFTPERPATATNNLCLLIKADVEIKDKTYDDRWYKFEFIRKEDEESDEFKPVNILRNYAYTVVIENVSNPGYASATEAYAATAGNLVVDMEVVREDDLNNIVYSGQYYLAITRANYTFSSISELKQMLKIHTNYPGGWTITPELSEWPNWMGDTWSAGSGLGNETTTGYLQPEPQLVNEDREFTFTVTAGSLSRQITVKQSKN